MARVIGQVVSTIKDERHRNWKLLIVQPVDDDGVPFDRSVVAIDSAQAGIGDYVLLCQEGKGARSIMRSEDAPVEAIIVGVIDHLLCRGEMKYLGVGGEPSYDPLAPPVSEEGTG